MVLVQKELKKVYLGNTQVRPAGWTPGANTLLYMPLDGDAKDYSGNNNDGTWTGTTDYQYVGVGSKKCAYLGQNSAIIPTSVPMGTGDPNDFTMAGWLKTNSSTGYGCLCHFGNDSAGKRCNLVINYKNGFSYVHINDIYQYDVYLSSSTSTPSHKGERICVVYTYSKSDHRHTLYVNNSKTGESTSYGLSIGTNYKYIGRPQSDSNYYLAEIVFESGIRTAEQRDDFYNNTKAMFGIS